MKRTHLDKGYKFYIRQPLWVIKTQEERVDDWVFSTKKYAELYLRKVVGCKKIVWDGKTLARAYHSRKKEDDQSYLLLFRRWMVIRFGKENNGTTGV